MSRRNDVGSQQTLHESINVECRSRFQPATPDAPAATCEERWQQARVFVERERAVVAATAASVPTEPQTFRAWMEHLERCGPGQHDPLFDFLEHEATLPQMRWFLAQEKAGEAGFDDLVALTQVKLPVVPKLELARNYWDEMGAGHRDGMHGPMLERLGHELALDRIEGPIVWESLALSNLLSFFALDRTHAFHSVGALGVVELTAPGRCEKVERGLKRLGVSGAGKRYYALHAVIDRTHWRRWADDVLEPLVAERPALARWIAEGALCRLEAGARLYRRYRAELGVAAPQAADRAA